jgi:hypothetical protein
MHLRQDQDGGQRLDPAETPQPRHRLAIGIRVRDLGEPCVELINRQEIVVDDRALSGMGPRELIPA